MFVIYTKKIIGRVDGVEGLTYVQDGDDKLKITIQGWDLAWYITPEGEYVLTAITGEDTKCYITFIAQDKGKHINDPDYVYEQAKVSPMTFVHIVS
jgi:hypothetical protein